MDIKDHIFSFRVGAGIAIAATCAAIGAALAGAGGAGAALATAAGAPGAGVSLAILSVAAATGGIAVLAGAARHPVSGTGAMATVAALALSACHPLSTRHPVSRASAMATVAALSVVATGGGAAVLSIITAAGSSVLAIAGALAAVVGGAVIFSTTMRDVFYYGTVLEEKPVKPHSLLAGLATTAGLVLAAGFSYASHVNQEISMAPDMEPAAIATVDQNTDYGTPASAIASLRGPFAVAVVPVSQTTDMPAGNEVIAFAYNHESTLRPG